MTIHDSVSRRQFLTRGAVIGGGLLAGLGATAPGIGVKTVSPIEMLARDHGIMRRVFFIYEEILRRCYPADDQPTDLIRQAAKIYQRVANDFHQKLEDEYLFPRMIKACNSADLVAILQQQHIVDHRYTTRLLALTSAAIFKDNSNRTETRDKLCNLARMMEPHMAWEESELYPAFFCLVSASEYRELGDIFARRQDQAFGADGITEMINDLAELETSLGIHNPAYFTPPQ